MVTNKQAIGRAKTRELAHRVTSSIEVTLLWRQVDNMLTLRLVEVGTGMDSTGTGRVAAASHITFRSGRSAMTRSSRWPRA